MREHVRVSPRVAILWSALVKLGVALRNLDA
jgi:hypothetical protein